MITKLTYTSTSMQELAACLKANGFGPERYQIVPEPICTKGSLLDISYEVCEIVFNDPQDETVFRLRISAEYASNTFGLDGNFDKQLARHKSTAQV